MDQSIGFVRMAFAILVGATACTGTSESDGAVSPREPAPSPPSRVAGELRQYAEALTREYGFSGSVLVARGDLVLLADGFGYADDDDRLPVSAETRFPIASATKPITATAVLLLEEAGRLRLAEPICTKVAPCPRRWRSIRIVDLLDQSAGLPDLPAASLDRPLMEVIDDLRDEPLLFPPGTDYTYSNSNYLLAGAIVEQASGMPWERFLRTKVFEPAGMTHTISDTDPKAQRDPVVGYSTSLSPIGERVPVTARLTRRMGHTTPDPSPAGGLLSTAEDLLAFVRFLDRGALLSPLTLDRMWTPRGPSRFADYGLGWERIQQNGTWVAQHGGAMPGFSSCVSLYPREDVYVLVLSNLGETVACEYIGRDLGAIVFGKPYRVPRAPSGTWVSPRTLRRYSGVYRPDVELGEEEVQVMVEGGRLVLRRVPAPAPGLNRESVLQPWSPTTFFNPHDPAVRISFRRIRNTVSMIFHRPAYKRLPPSWERWTKSPEEPPRPAELGGEGL